MNDECEDCVHIKKESGCMLGNDPKTCESWYPDLEVKDEDSPIAT